MFIVLLGATEHGTTVLVKKGLYTEVTSTYGKGCVCEFQSGHTLSADSVYSSTKQTHTHTHTPFNSGSRHPLARQQGQPIHTVTTQQGSNSRGPLKSHYCTSLVKLVTLWERKSSTGQIHGENCEPIFCCLDFSFQGQSLEETHKNSHKTNSCYSFLLPPASKE